MEMRFIRLRYRFVAAIVLTLLLAGCGNPDTGEHGAPADPASQNRDASLSGDSRVTIYSARPDDDGPTVRHAGVESIRCETAPGQQKTRADLNGGGFVLVEDQRLGSQAAWRITIALPELEFTHRDSILPAQVGDTFDLDEVGSVRGIHQFQVYGDDPVQYGFKLDLQCQGV